MKPSPRRRSREIALQALYAWQLAGGNPLEELRLLDEEGRADRELAEALVRGVLERAEPLRALIAPCLDRDFARLSELSEQLGMNDADVAAELERLGITPVEELEAEEGAEAEAVAEEVPPPLPLGKSKKAAAPVEEDESDEGVVAADEEDDLPRGDDVAPAKGQKGAKGAKSQLPQKAQKGAPAPAPAPAKGAKAATKLPQPAEKAEKKQKAPAAAPAADKKT